MSRYYRCCVQSFAITHSSFVRSFIPLVAFFHVSFFFLEKSCFCTWSGACKGTEIGVIFYGTQDESRRRARCTYKRMCIRCTIAWLETKFMCNPSPFLKAMNKKKKENLHKSRPIVSTRPLKPSTRLLIEFSLKRRFSRLKRSQFRRERERENKKELFNIVLRSRGSRWNYLTSSSWNRESILENLLLLL